MTHDLEFPFHAHTHASLHQRRSVIIIAPSSPLIVWQLKSVVPIQREKEAEKFKRRTNERRVRMCDVNTSHMCHRCPFCASLIAVRSRPFAIWTVDWRLVPIVITFCILFFSIKYSWCQSDTITTLRNYVIYQSIIHFIVSFINCLYEKPNWSDGVTFGDVKRKSICPLIKFTNVRRRTMWAVIVNAHTRRIEYYFIISGEATASPIRIV